MNIKRTERKRHEKSTGQLYLVTGGDGPAPEDALGIPN